MYETLCILNASLAFDTQSSIGTKFLALYEGKAVDN